jgi:RNA polymerase sigma-70 factor (ECF subfamily)
MGASAIPLSEGGKALEVGLTTTEGSKVATDSELVRRARTGDAFALEMLFRRHETAVFRFACRMLASVDDADDVRQEAFVRAFSSLDRYRQEAAFKTYVLTICANICRDRLRARQRRPEVSYGLAPAEDTCAASASGDPMKAALASVEMKRVRATMAQIAPTYREVLHLRHVEELSLEEIAAVVGCSRIAAPVRLFRARQAFQKAYLTIVRQEDGE